MIIQEGLIASRFVHAVTLLIIYGITLFLLYAFAGQPRLAHGWRGLHSQSRFRAACLFALASGISWLLFACAAMSGSLSEAFTIDMLGMVMSETGFGFVWGIHLALVTALVLAALLASPSGPVLTIVFVLLSAASLGTLAGVGHTQAQTE